MRIPRAPKGASMHRFLAAAAAAALACLVAQPVRGQGQTLFYTVGVPRAPATDRRPLVNVMRIAGVKIEAKVEALDAIRPAAPGRPAETPAEASQRKADAIVKATNDAIDAKVAAGLLPANAPRASKATEPATVHERDPIGRPVFLDRFGRRTLVNTGTPSMIRNAVAGFGIVTIPGVTEVLGPKDGSRDPTGEPNGPAGFRDGGGTGGGGTGGGSMGSQGSMGGTGRGFSTGIDVDGDGGSMVAFGLITDLGRDADCTPVLPPASPCPGAFIATLNPGAGRDEDSVLAELAALFNSLFPDLDVDAVHDPVADLLGFTRALRAGEGLLVQNTDPGLELAMLLRPVPEPAALALFGAGLAVLGLVLRRRSARRAQAAQQHRQ
jgi:uncharacterized membrane protein YgcG